MAVLEQLDKKMSDAVHRRARFVFCCALFAAFLVLALTGCAAYQLDHITTTTTLDSQGEPMRVVKHCSVSVISSREVRGADLAVNEQCEVSGGAGALGANAEAIGLIKDIVRTLP